MKGSLIIGATATVGRHVASQLTAVGAQVHALTRHLDAAVLPPQVEVVQGDLTLPETLDSCLDGIDTGSWVAAPTAVVPALELLTTIPTMLLDAWAAAIGQPAFVTSTIADITGKPARTLLDWSADHAAD